MTRQQIARRILGGGGLIDAHTHLGADAALYYNGDFPYAICAEDHGVRMAHSGIAHTVCFPFLYSSYYQLPAFRRGEFRRDRRGLSSFPYEFENGRLCREIYEAFPEYAGRLLPFAFFDPARRPREQADGIRALAARYPVFGLKTATSYQHSHITELLGKGACLLDLAVELDVPVTIHSAVLPGDPWANVFEILKVVKARPDVRFAIAHTCRFDRRALDMAHALDNCYVDFSAFHIHCTLARQNHPAVACGADRYPADYRRHAAAMRKIAEAYPGTMLWGSDIPAHLWKSRFRNDKGEEVWMSLSCGPDTEVEELRRLPRGLVHEIAHVNTTRWLFGTAATKRPASTRRS
jgi:predicted TIM-barrel fold metal-dependent hydrolase